jgi:lipoprotein-anchoring transpeptidase ErfK/SrfK
MRRRAWWTRWWAIVGAVVVVIGGASAAYAASTGSSAPKADPKAPAKSAVNRTAIAAALTAAEEQLAAGVSVSPATGQTGVLLNSPVVVAAQTGTLTSVVVTGPGGAPLPGSLSASGTEWRSSAILQPTTTYHVSATVTRADGLRGTRVTSFTTLTPTYEVEASVFPQDGMSVGVGQPIVFNFDHWIETAAGQAAAYSHIHISMSKPVPGGWYWFSPHELHFRPKDYWPSGEQVHVTANFNGWDGGNGRWGIGTVDDTFSIGAARISIANLQTEEMTVTLNGAVVATYPISGGRQQYPTMDGDHIVLDRESVVHMVSSTVGIPVNSPNGYNEYVYNDVHISDSGEYVHSAPWSVGAQGVTNVSHGCINMSPANSLTFFNESRVGDVVEVTGSPRPPVMGDHGVMDWSTPWSQWTPATVT